MAPPARAPLSNSNRLCNRRPKRKRNNRGPGPTCSGRDQIRGVRAPCRPVYNNKGLLSNKFKVRHQEVRWEPAVTSLWAAPGVHLGLRAPPRRPGVLHQAVAAPLQGIRIRRS
uniref:Uncharacterized protein n=1 Tax=Cacopsylla melanoneura TaxID=428564 RepID=A0A8D8R5V9_9HEMI